MAAFFPLISEILAMIMPACTQIVRASDVQQSDAVGQPTAVPAVVNACDKMCASVLTLPPKTATAVRQNSEQDAIVFVVAGAAELLVHNSDKDEAARHSLGPEHRAENQSDLEARWAIFQGGPRPIGAELEDWGGDEITPEK
ncbi:hypothetical protein NLU13_7595 [Sarocladium strictum]|uniref:Uncharacterized protein n=1 Tax=Sarocladium strictum TaxID=5046 RepID=A0AA39GD33_SARSR|nr:hypothetical protein NLU13_7595 [Sarocladium strictum]